MKIHRKSGPFEFRLLGRSAFVYNAGILRPADSGYVKKKPKGSGRFFRGYRQITDAYLFGLAMRKGGVLATFDAGIAALAEAKSGCLRSIQILKA